MINIKKQKDFRSFVEYVYDDALVDVDGNTMDRSRYDAFHKVK